MIANATITFATDLKHLDKPRDSVGYLLAHALKGVSCILEQNFRTQGYNISRNHWMLLAKSHFCPDGYILQSEMVQHFRGDKTVVTRTVDDLVKLGWLRQEIDPDDRRNRRLLLSDEGNEVLPVLKECVEKTLEQVSQEVTKEEMEATKSALRKIIENAQNLKA